MSYLYVKRFFDLTVSLAALVLLSPLIILIILLLLIACRGRIFFTQERPGKNEKLFRVIKFKTMNDRKDSNGKLLPDSQRLTTTGKIIRSLSLDELPQLLNVLAGDMSLIGPRPLLPKYLPLYNSFQKRRHEVRPGITGWAQVNGRNAISWEQKFKHDVWYVDNISFLLDLKIIWLTVKKILVREGINASENTPMAPFTGNN